MITLVTINLRTCFQEEELDEHKVQITPPGFHVIILPFADDFRKVKLDETVRGKKNLNLKNALN